MAQELRRLVADRIDRLAHGGERRGQMAGMEIVVEADQRNVGGHLPAGALQRQQRAGRDIVVAGEDGGQRLAAGEQLLGGGKAEALDEVAMDDGDVVEAEPCSLSAAAMPRSRSWVSRYMRPPER